MKSKILQWKYFVYSVSKIRKSLSNQHGIDQYLSMYTLVLKFNRSKSVYLKVIHKDINFDGEGGIFCIASEAHRQEIG